MLNKHISEYIDIVRSYHYMKLSLYFCLVSPFVMHSNLMEMWKERSYGEISGVKVLTTKDFLSSPRQSQGELMLNPWHRHPDYAFHIKL